jgi:hypothetical protein
MKISKNYLLRIIREEIERVLDEGEPENISSNSPHIKKFEKSLVDMLQKSYSYMGGWKGLETPEALKHRFTNFFIVDVDDDEEPDAGIYYTDWKGSKKASALVSDGTSEGKIALRDLMKTFFNQAGSWCEVSGAPANIGIKKLGLHWVHSEKAIRQLLSSLPQEDIEFYGKHPDPSVDYGDGWYSRTIAGKRETKIIIGNP